MLFRSASNGGDNALRAISDPRDERTLCNRCRAQDSPPQLRHGHFLKDVVSAVNRAAPSRADTKEGIIGLKLAVTCFADGGVAEPTKCAPEVLHHGTPVTAEQHEP